MDVFSLPALGLNVSAAQVAQFMADYVIPAAIGLIASGMTEETKKWVSDKLAMLPDRVRTYFLRALTAAACVLLNTGMTLWITGGVDWSLVPESFFSYLAAVAAFDHLFKKKPSQAPEQEYQ